ncbi:MAG TPA: TraR/DksA family transcriptional regulator [Bryobacteraceae bacterium]|nr:TraR/DksA family transcriptional regulator [Bryobacteraceae bacterium]
MSTLDLSEFRRLLEAKYNELSSTARNRDEIAIEATADEMDSLQQRASRDIAIRNLDHTARLLKSVQAALDRMEDEIYGVCLRCEEPIPAKRLKAVPWASHCIHCQETIDRRSLPEDENDTFESAA